ncbi:pimeloyl-ACP methyl ester carboxylesterase [Diaminobutyricimonas aerilata]|uniref:Pimeloyl-ACP methyl ester carboxylesterase n=1 Tax=Diaminobutyricimonas aerilata TaxID=1162967 RepID=A0A2M9CF81_9MICO|nr:epoxide hydrolase family protein [Diaminobutyricimonas aerilata]PJJ70527.1 pimeloyl-ACP methyl ester carboxylesterase [Diaminobutyricimonas aerilata]
MDDDITPFSLRIDDGELADLHRRLDATRLPDALPGDDWAFGVPVTELQRAVDGWGAFDWRAFERRLADVPQFTTEFDGQRIHFAHVRSERADAVPLLLIHGWPGSFLEFVGLIDRMTDPVGDEPAFHVVIPSLPGFGFSTPLASLDWPTSRIAAAFAELMSRLGYERFAVQGGDIGAGVAPEIGRVCPERVIGVHVNGALGEFVSELDDATTAVLQPFEHDRMRRVHEFMQNEFAYISLQSTRPALLGAMVADSPVAQLAWMWDKYRAWSHPLEATPEEALGADFVFGNLGLYWFTRSAGSAAAVGYAQQGAWGAEPQDSGVPTAAIQFAHDIGIRAVAERSNTIVRWTDVHDRGGHFAALEEPEMLLDDLRAFIRSL